jgi:epoxyqueuosine reductase
MTLQSTTIRRLAGECGFDICGITTPEPIPEAAARLRQWLDRNFHGEMAWMERNQERRVDPGQLLEAAKSIVILGLNYYRPDPDMIHANQGLVSKYARGKDYHKVFRKKIEHLIYRIRQSEAVSKEANFKWWVDYGPFLERAYAA